jgi:hypothetical protein
MEPSGSRDRATYRDEVLGKEGRTDQARAALQESVAILAASLGAENGRTKRAQAVLAALH